jgi:hypothetical protein
MMRESAVYLTVELLPLINALGWNSRWISGGRSTHRNQEYFPGVPLSILPSNLWAVHPFFL